MSRPPRRDFDGAPRTDTVQVDPTPTVPRAAVLDHWAHADWTDGCQIDKLPDFQPLTVITMNHLYEIIVLDGREGLVRVRGGQFFPEWRDAHLAGCSLGGSFLKLRGIYTGFCMELHVGGEVIVTSPARKLTLMALDVSHLH